MMKRRTDTLVVIPTYCERPNISRIVEAVLEAIDTDVLVVDDDSPDGTGQVAQEMAAADSRVMAMCRVGKPRGLGYAYRDGFAHALAAAYRFVIQMDADGSHDPAHLPAMREAAERVDLVIGSRYVPGGSVPDWTLVRRLISRGGSAYARLVLGLPVRDVTGGFKCWRAEALGAVDPSTIKSRGFSFQIEMNHRAVRAGLRLRELPIRFCDRRRGRSKMSLGIVAEGLSAVWRIRFWRWP